MMEYAGCDPGPLQHGKAETGTGERSDEPEVARLKVLVVDCKQGAVRAVRFSVDGNYCLTAGQDKTVKLWRLTGDSLCHLKTLSGRNVRLEMS